MTKIKEKQRARITIEKKRTMPYESEGSEYIEMDPNRTKGTPPPKTDKDIKK